MNWSVAPSAFQRRLDAGWRDEIGQAVGVTQIALNRRHDNSRFNRKEVDSNERHTNPCIDDDAFVQHVVKNVDDARRARYAFKSHPAARMRSARRSKE
jgi:hypothetical protein